MGKSAKEPPMPDYIGAAKQTAESNLEAARSATAANRVNQVTPWGSLTYSQAPRKFNQSGYDAAMMAYNSQPQQATTGGYTGRPLSSARSQSEYQQIKADMNRLQPSQQASRGNAPSMGDFYEGSPDGGWTAEVKLDPMQQQLLDQQNKTSLAMGGLQDSMMGQVRDSMGRPISMADLPTISGDYAKTGYDAIMSRLNPQLDDQRKSFDTQMANQGITLGSEAYNNAFKNQSQSANDARIQAGLQGIGIGQQQQNQQMALQNQQYGLLSSMRDRPLNQLNALRAGSQVQAPSFINAPQQATTGGVDYNQVAGLQNQYNMGLYNSKVGQNNNLMNTLGGLGGAAIGLFSDERLKTNIQRIGTHDTLGIGIYKYEKFGVPEIGVLAQELEKVAPDAVSMHSSGFKVIDMGVL